MRTIKKSQILTLTLFVMFISLSAVLILLIPVNYQLIRIRKIIYSFQAFSQAESNLEVGNLYVVRNKTINGFNYHYSFYVDNQECIKFGEKMGISDPDWIYLSCEKIQIVPVDEATTTEIYYAKVYVPNLPHVYSFYSKLISEGNYKELKRVLDFDFLP